MRIVEEITVEQILEAENQLAQVIQKVLELREKCPHLNAVKTSYGGDCNDCTVVGLCPTCGLQESAFDSELELFDRESLPYISNEEFAVLGQERDERFPSICLVDKERTDVWRRRAHISPY